MRHGTLARFRAGCRCPACDAAAPHGAFSGYANWHCRCGPCRACHAAYMRAWRARGRAVRGLGWPA